jgi:hypothetical protein
MSSNGLTNYFVGSFHLSLGGTSKLILKTGTVDVYSNLVSSADATAHASTNVMIFFMIINITIFNILIIVYIIKYQNAKD